MFRSLRYLSAALVALATLGATAQDSASAAFRAGAANSNITPKLGTSLAGNMRDQIARNIHDELQVRCIVLDDGTTQLAFAIVDSCMVPREIIDDAKSRAEEATDIPRAHMLVAANHSHTAACATPIFQSNPNPEYLAFLTQRIADGITRAARNLEPARIGWGTAELADEVFNRRWHMKPGTVPENPFGATTDQVKMNPPRASEDLIEPAGPIDPEIAFVSIQHQDGRPLALLANYSLHYVGGTGGGEVSADYFGIFADRIQELLGADRQAPPFVGIMSNGTSGDINNINFREAGVRQEPYEQMTKVAHKAATAVHEVLSEVVYQDWVSLASAQKELQLGVRKADGTELAAARKVVDVAAGREMKLLPEIYARETVLLNDYPEKVPVLIQVFRLGDLAIAQIPCEVFAEIGLDIKAHSPFGQTFTIELANGYNGYLPTPDQHALGGYETWRARSSYLEVDASTKILATVHGLLNTLAD